MWVSSEYYAEDRTIGITLRIRVPADLETEYRNLQIGDLKKVFDDPGVNAENKLSFLLEFLLRSRTQNEVNNLGKSGVRAIEL